MSLVATLKVLEWDSAFFGKKIGLLVLGGSQKITDESLCGFDLIQAKVLGSDYVAIDILGHHGFRLAGSDADFCLLVKQTERQPGVRIAKPSQIPVLRRLAAQLFVYSRYREPWFSVQQNQALYSQWVENAVLGSFDNLCLVVCAADGQIEGFVTLRLHSDHGRIGLLGVLPTAQGKGRGLQLLRAAADCSRAQGCVELRIATQLSNLKAMRLYHRAGAELATIYHWFYR